MTLQNNGCAEYPNPDSEKHAPKVLQIADSEMYEQKLRRASSLGS